MGKESHNCPISDNQLERAEYARVGLIGAILPVLFGYRSGQGASVNDSNASQRVALVVEDEWLIRAVTASELVDAGWSVLEAASGEDAVALLDDGVKIDLVITDIQLGGSVTGWDVAEQCRRRDPSVILVYISGNPPIEKRRVERSVFISKPCDIPQLLKSCQDIARGDRRPGEGKR